MKPMKGARLLAALGSLTAAALGLCACAHQAKSPSSPVGQTEAQAWSAPPNDVPAEFPRQVEPPPGARLAPTSGITALGMERIYESHLPYHDAVDFFDRTLLEEGCESIRRTQTKTSTVWVAQCASGDRVHVSVRQTDPTTVSVLEPTVVPALQP